MGDFKEIDIKTYWHTVKNRKYIFIAVSLFVLSVIVWGSFFVPKIYRAESTVLIERNIIGTLVKGLVVTPSMVERLRVLKHVMNSRAMVLKVISALDLDAKAKSPTEIEDMIKNLQNNVSIQMKGNDLLKVSFKGRDPKIVRDYVNTLISTYIEANTSSKREETYSANKFLSNQIAHYKKKLDDSEEKLSKFRIKKGLYFAEDEKTMVISIKDYQENIKNLQIKIKGLEAKREKIKQQLSGEKPLTLAMIDRSTGGSLQARLSILEQKIPILLTRYTENYPEVIRIKAEIETIKKQIEGQGQSQVSEEILSGDHGLGTSAMNPVYQQLKEELFKTESEIDSMRAEATSMKSRVEKIETELRNMPKDKRIVNALVKERDSNQRIHAQLLSRLGQAEVSKQMELEDKGTSFRIVDSAIMPTKPVSPNRIKYILFGIAAAISAGFGTVYLLESFDKSIKDVDTLKSVFGIPVIGVIPKIITDEDIIKNKRLDRTIYTISIAYLSIIGIVFINEIANRFLFLQ